MTYSLSLKSQPTKEGATGTTGAYVYTVTRSDISAAETVQWAVAASDPSTSNNRGANAADFGGTFPSGSVSFAAGQDSQTFTFNVVGDNTDEFDTEIFNVGIVNTTTVIEGRIIDDDDVSGVRTDTSPQLKVNSSIKTHVSTSDVDTYRMTLQAGVTYMISSSAVEGKSVNFGHFDVLDSFGVKLVSYVDTSGSTKFTPTTSGMYFMSLYSDYNHGGYEISLTTDNTVSSTSSVALSAAVDNAILLGYANINAIGNGNNNVFITNFGNNAIDGGGGIDTAQYSNVRSNFSIAKTSTGFTLTDRTGVEGTDTLQNVERVKFSDASISLDVGSLQPGGQTALLVGAVLPGQLVFDSSKQELLGSVIGLFDQGYTLQQLSGAVMRLPIWNELTGKSSPTSTDIANYLLTNVTGAAPDATTLATAVAALNAQTDINHGQGDFLWQLAASSANQTHVGFVGLPSTGLVFVA